MSEIKRGKGSKSKGKSKLNDNKIKIISHNNQLHVESDDEFKNYDNKKLKVETHNDTKIVIPAPIIYQPKFLNEALTLLRKYGSDNEAFENTQETLNKLRVAFDYKYKSQKVVFTKDIFERKLKNSVNTSIFTRKNLQIRLNKPKTPMQLAFENYLNLVSQLYYKATHQLEDGTANIQAQELFKNNEDEKPIIQIEKPKRPGRKAKPKPLPPSSQENQNGQNKIPGVNQGGDGEKITQNEDNKNQGEALVLSCNDVLDSLVSPLRLDYVFEKWSPKEIATFEAALCKYGKEFSFIQFLVKTKNLNEVMEFYFAWKNTTHYKIWKHYKNIENKTNYNSWL